MNKILIIAISIILGLATLVNAQKKGEIIYETPEVPVDETTQKIIYTKVVDATGSKDILFRKAITWFNKYYKNPTNVIREKDEVAGKIVAKARIKVLNPPDKKGVQTMKGIVVYTLTCEFKEGRFKYTLNDINLKAASYYACERWLDTESQTYSQVYNFFLQQVNDEINKTLTALKKHVTASDEKKPEDW